MEDTTTPRGYNIVEAKIPILLTLKKTEELRPHEETVQEDLNGILRALQTSPVLRHPIIADTASGAVLDGTHRLAALKQLGCRRIPAALIDYQNPLVQIDRWFRLIKGRYAEGVRNAVEHLSPLTVSDNEADQSLLARTCYASLRYARDCLAFQSKDNVPLNLCRRAFALEQVARNIHAKVSYTDKAGRAELSPSTILMSTIRLEKKEVVDACFKHVLFPPKSTRHLIPSRPLGLTVPLELLRDPNAEHAEEEFEKHLSRKRIRRLPEGSVVGSRRYMEEVFLFE